MDTIMPVACLTIMAQFSAEISIYMHVK
jgi:hypothetical protein